MLTETTFLETLKSDCYVDVPFPIEQQLLQEAIDAFFKFLQEPDVVKNFINFTIAPKHRRGDVGYKHREAKDHIYNDDKEFFHFHPAILAHHPEFLAQNPIVADFVRKANEIWDLVYTTIYHIFTLMEKKFTGIRDKIFATENVHILLRFLKYGWQQSGKYLAKPHFDAGSCTLAIAESYAGLRIGHGPEDLQLVKQRPGHALFMLSSNYRHLFDSPELSAGWHDVIQIDETLIGKPFSRWAIVAFIEAHGVEALPRTETHRWYQP